MPYGGHVVALSEIRFEEVSRRCLKALRQSMPLDTSLCHLEHFGPVHRKNLYVRGLLRQRDSPHARPRADVQNAGRGNQLRNLQMVSQRLCRPITHWEDSLHQFSEEFRAPILLVDRLDWLARPHTFGQSHPGRHHLAGYLLKEAAVVVRFARNQKGGTLRRQRVSVSCSLQEFETH